MGWYGRKSIKIMPGVHLNFSKTGVGYSIGPRGAKYTVSPRGRVTQSVSIPGTGIRYQTSHTPPKKTRVMPHDDYTPQHVSSYHGIWATWFTMSAIDFVVLLVLTYLKADALLLNVFQALFWVFMISGFISWKFLRNK